MTTGSVQEKNNKLYCVLNFKDESGKRVKKWIKTGLTAKGNKKRAESMLSEYLEKENEKAVNIVVDNIQEQHILFCDFIGEWLELHKSNIQLVSFNNYYSMWQKHVYPYFKRLKSTLDNLQPIQIHKYYSDKVKSGLNPNTVLKHHALIRSTLQYAKKMGLIKDNVADLIDKPKKKKFIGNFLNKDEIHQLLTLVKGTPVETPVMFACYFGLRRSEILGIKWSAVDFQNRTISIKHKIVPVIENGKYRLQGTDSLKTTASYRTLPIDEYFNNYLVNLKATQESNKKLCGKSYNQEYKDYICVNNTGNLLLPNYVSKAFKNILEKNDMKIVRFHDLRHSTASLLLSLGHNFKEIQWLLGHGDIGTTMNIYSHLGTSEKINVVKGISNALDFS